MSKIGHLRIRKDKQGNIRYQIIIEVWRDGERFRKSKTCSSEKKAIQWGNKHRYEIEQGIITKESLNKRKLSEAIDKYITEILPLKPKNARNVEQHLKWWRVQLGHFKLTELKPAQFSEKRDKLLTEPISLNKKRAPATVVRYLSSISSVVEAAIKDWHWIEKNPVRMIRKPPVSNAKTRFLSAEEAQRLLSACKESRNPYLHSIVVIALSTGMRRGEILSLRWEDIDFDKKLIVLRQTKNGSIRYVPLVSPGLEVFKCLFQQETIIDTSHHIFPSLNPIRYLDIRTAWQFALKRSGISDDFTFHTLRHSCASFLAMSGASQRDIAEILGHKDLRMTHRYSHLSQSHLAERLERAAEKFITTET